jgi:Tol biopolymer transport system component
MIAFVNWGDLPTRPIGIDDGLYTVKPDGSGLRRLYSGGYLSPGITPDWSPHGSRIVFAAATKQAPDNQEMFTVKANGRGLRQLRTRDATDPFRKAPGPDNPQRVWIDMRHRRGNRCPADQATTECAHR